MSKSKFNYKVYNGKAIKKLLENSKIYVMALLFGAGIIIGAACINNDLSVMNKIADITVSYVELRSQQGIADIFLNSIYINTVFILLNAFFAFSLVGYPFLTIIPLIRGMGIGAVTGYLYSAYKMSGLGFCLLTIYPAAVVSTVAFILACNDSCNYSKNAFLKAIKGRGHFEKDETKLYLIRQTIYLGVCVVSSAADALFSTAFSGFFEI